MYDTLASSSAARRIALWLRNFATQVLAHRLAPTTLPEHNGEMWLIGQLGPSLRTVLDVGANTGEWTQSILDAAPAVERVVCFEPGEAALRALGRHTEDKRVSIVDAAVSDHAGEHEFLEVRDAGVTSSLVAVPGDTPHVSRTVRVVTIDDELSRLSIEHVDMMKIDVEGMDLHVLQGAAQALADHRIELIQFEHNILWAAAGSTLAAAFSLLRQHGYEVYALLTDGLYSYEPSEFGELYVYSNFVAVLPHSRLPVQPARARVF